MNKPRLYIVTGISGSGKTTVARELIKQGQVAFDSKINTGIFRFEDVNGEPPQEYDITNASWRTKYKWVLNIPMLEELISKNSSAKQVFLCGRGNIRQHWGLADEVYLLKVDTETMLNRLNDPNRDNIFANDEATQLKLSNELDYIQNGLIKAGAVVIDATLPVEVVVSDITSHAARNATSVN